MKCAPPPFQPVLRAGADSVAATRFAQLAHVGPHRPGAAAHGIAASAVVVGELRQLRRGDRGEL